jgi:hypothetical protein
MPFIREPAYNISAPAVVAANARTVRELIVQTAGTAGVLTLNDAATLAQASIANQIVSLPLAVANGWVGMPYPFAGDWPLQNGLVISAIPTGMIIAIKYEIWVN